MAGSKRGSRSRKAGVHQRKRAVTPAFLSAKFWREFGASTWEKRPALYPSASARPIVSEREIFRAVLRAAGLAQREEEGAAVAFYIEHARVEASVEDYLPQAADGDFARYARRISRLTEGRRVGLIVQDLQAHSFPLWERLTYFLNDLDIAVPAAGVRRRASLFVGNYAITPRGLHGGNSANFKFVIRGRKRMRLWPASYFRGRKGINHTRHVEPFLGDATTLTGRVGDIIYWPSDQWHVGEALGGLAISLSLAIFVDSQAPAIRPMNEKTIAARLNRQTGGGFDHVPPPARMQQLPARGSVRRISPRPILSHTMPDGSLICSANGRAFAIKASPGIREILNELNGGQSLFLKASGRDRARFALLQKLLQLRAIVAVGG